MKAEEIPAELRDILDRRAGKEHGANGPVLAALAEILTRHREMLLGGGQIESVTYVALDDHPQNWKGDLRGPLDQLPQPWFDALAELLEDIDRAKCAECRHAVGYVVHDDDESRRPSTPWVPTRLVREGAGPVVLMCEDCAPYVPAPPG